ncbi:MAG: hypothetical protein QXU40_01620 [Candidatus Pacearchaeota archaeon]
MVEKVLDNRDILNKINETLRGLNYSVTKEDKNKKLEDLCRCLLLFFKNSDTYFEDFWKDKVIIYKDSVGGRVSFDLLGLSPYNSYPNFLTIDYRGHLYEIGVFSPWWLRKIIEEFTSKIEYKKRNSSN